MKYKENLFDAELTPPEYEGGSILNIPASVGEILNVSGFPNQPLNPGILETFSSQVDNLILVLVDALAYHRLEEWLNEDPELPWHKIAENGILAPLTSICPSTTCAAITSFWTGRPAAEHGIIGYEMWLKEFGIVTNMIEHKPITYRARGGGLELAGFEPESFLNIPSVSDLYHQQGIETHAFQHFAIINSGLSRMFMGDAVRHGIRSSTDMWIGIRELLESRRNQRKYIWAYWDSLDGISHLYGPDSERARAEFFSFSASFRNHFLNKLDPTLHENTAVILTADHGMITTDRDNSHYHLINHPEFLDMLHLRPTGENRLAFLHVKPGKHDQIREYMDRAWPDEFLLLEPQKAVEEGMFGPGSPHPELPNRMGDLIVAAKGDAYWWWADKPNPLIGRHGGLSSEEMMVPFLGGRLG